MEQVKVELKNLVVVDNTAEKGDNHNRSRFQRFADSYAVILARALLLFLLTFDLFLNAFVLLSLDRMNLAIGVATIACCAVGQFASITGQFGYSVGDLLLKIFVLSGLFLLVLSMLFDQFEQNFMTELSFFFTLSGFLTGCFIMFKTRK
ncbi:hypothetical protein TYRP_004056 [Tyrophagus putrescentiae]|nr:hypothetical protein TYRP_004056 [Tyrophagus putrescentiae]